MAQEKFLLNGEFIKLDALLKATGLAPSGGIAKEMIQAGDVTVNGEKETRRGAKLRGGEVVSVQGSGREILVAAAASCFTGVQRIFRSSRRRIFPTGDLGSASVKTIFLGRL